MSLRLLLARAPQAGCTLSLSQGARAYSTPVNTQAATATTQAATTARTPSSCPEGQVLKGLCVLKGKTDPLAKKDDEYPEWLWTLLDPKPQGLSKSKSKVALRRANRDAIKSLNFLKDKKT